MFWIMFNMLFSALNLVLAMNASSIGWAIFSAFCSGISFAAFIFHIATYESS